MLNRALQLGQNYPDIIKEVRGQGLMVGIEFYDLDDCGSFDMAYMCERGGFTALLAGFLLNVYHIRLRPFEQPYDGASGAYPHHHFRRNRPGNGCA